MTALFLGVFGYVPLWGQNIDFTPDRPDGPAKLQSALWELATPGAAKRIRDLQDTVVVILVPYLGQASASIDTSSLAELGVRVLAQSKSLMRVSVPSSSLLAVSELSGVRFVRRPYRPHSQVTISEGVSRIGALANHSAGVKGQGVKVAIIDGGFKGADELPGNMPGFWWVDFTGEGIYAGEDVHGTACAEIVHDVAPEAELYLYKIEGLLDLENAKDRAIRDGIDVISHSVTFPTTGFGDGEGLACDIVNDAATKGILWVNSAGNYAKSHYEGFWSDSDDDGWHNFEDKDEVLSFEAEKGNEISVFLTWNDWPNSRDNYDLYLSFVNSSGDVETVAESTDRQNISGGEPVESIEYKVERSGKYGIVVRSEDARPRRLKIWSFDHDFEEYAVAKNSIGIPSDARGSMSVGAIFHRAAYWNAGRIADYSSRGPTTDGRIKPDLVAPTGVSTVSYDPDPYHGTSAAAPHVAGAAALIKSANPSYSRGQLWNALVAARVDIGPRGKDNDSGYGKLVLPIMRVSANTSPRISSVSPRTVRTNTVVTVSGSNFGSSRGSSSVRIGSVVIPSSAFTSWSSSRIRFRIPRNTPPGNLTVRTSQGTSNAIRLQITSPYLTRISPTRAKTGERLTLTGGNFGNRRGTGYVFFTSNVRPSAADYVSWSSSRIVVRVPARARSGNVQVTTSNGTSGTKLLQIESRSPQITSVSPRRVQYNQVVTVIGSNFGSSRGSSTVRIGSIAIPSSSLASWSNTIIRFRVPTDMRSGNVVVRTSEGTSNAIRLEITSPYLASVSPTRIKTGDRLTLTGGNFGNRRNTGYVLFTSNVRPSVADYVSWSNSRIVVKVPARAQSGNVRVTTSNGTSGTKRIVVESSPHITSVSPRQVLYNQEVTVTGINFGSSRGSSTVRVGSAVIPSSSLDSWSNTRIRFRVPTNMPSGNVTVRTSKGTSNAILLEILSPYLASVSPSNVKPGDRLTLTGANFRSRRGGSYVRFAPNVRPASGDYVTWSDRRIVVKVPAGAQSGDVKVAVIGAGASGTKRIVVGSSSPPRITSVSPRQVQYDQVVTVIGSNFGSSRGSSTVRVGSVVILSSSLASWSNTIIRFRVPTDMRSGNVVVRTSEGTSNAIRLEITSPYLASVSPTRIKTGDRLTLTGGNFGNRRNTGYVLFTSNVRPSVADYVSWSNSRIVVKVPARAQSGNVRVTTSNGTSGTKRIVVESSPHITSVSPRQVLYNQEVTVTGINFGSSRGSSTVRVGSAVIPSSSLDSWSNTRIRFRVPTNMPSGNVTVRTSKGTSNAILLEILSPYLASVSPSNVKPGDRLTLTGANFRSRRGGSYVRFAPNVRPASGDYVTWSDRRIVVKVPAGAQSGDVKVAVIGAGASGTKRIVVGSSSPPRITSVSPRQVQYNQVVTVTGSNFGSSRGSSTVRIGSVVIPSSSLASWSNTRIRFRVPTNVRSGSVTVRTSAGTSNAIRLEITSPYLASVSPSSVKPGDRLTLTGANFRSSRGSGYVLFTPNVRPSSGDYVTWSDSRIVVKVPARARSGDVKVVVTGSQSSGTKRITVEGDVVESLPSRGLFGYSPPAVTKNPKSVKFGFDEKSNSSIACYFSAKEVSDSEVTIFFNEQSYSEIPESEDWTHWYLVLDRSYLRSDTNIIEFRNVFNQNRTSSFARWQLKDVWVAEPPPSAKLVAGAQLLSKLPDAPASGLGDPFPTPFNAEVTIPFALAEARLVRLTGYHLMGQQIRVLADGWVDAGAHSMRWDGRTDAGVETASGVYWAVLQAGGAVQTAKLALIR